MERYYRILDLYPGATKGQVKEAYRTLAKVWHPDRFQGDEKLRKKAEEKFKLINEAYEKLKDYEPEYIRVQPDIPHYKAQPKQKHNTYKPPQPTEPFFKSSDTRFKKALKVAFSCIFFFGFRIGFVICLVILMLFVQLVGGAVSMIRGSLRSTSNNTEMSPPATKPSHSYPLYSDWYDFLSENGINFEQSAEDIDGRVFNIKCQDINISKRKSCVLNGFRFHEFDFGFIPWNIGGDKDYAFVTIGEIEKDVVAIACGGSSYTINRGESESFFVPIKCIYQLSKPK